MHVTIIQKIIDIIRGKEFQKAKERKQAFKKNEINIAKSCKNKIHFTIKGVNNKITIPETCNILKNFISIVGCNSVFSGGEQYQSYCTFAGNPASVIKKMLTGTLTEPNMAT